MSSALGKEQNKYNYRETVRVHAVWFHTLIGVARVFQWKLKLTSIFCDEQDDELVGRMLVLLTQN